MSEHDLVFVGRYMINLGLRRCLVDVACLKYRIVYERTSVYFLFHMIHGFVE